MIVDSPIGIVAVKCGYGNARQQLARFHSLERQPARAEAQDCLPKRKLPEAITAGPSHAPPPLGSAQKFPGSREMLRLSDAAKPVQKISPVAERSEHDYLLEAFQLEKAEPRMLDTSKPSTYPRTGKNSNDSARSECADQKTSRPVSKMKFQATVQVEK